MHIAVQAIKKLPLTGKLEADRQALQDTLPAIQWTAPRAPSSFGSCRLQWQAGRLRQCKPLSSWLPKAASTSFKSNRCWRSDSSTPFPLAGSTRFALGYANFRRVKCRESGARALFMLGASPRSGITVLGVPLLAAVFVAMVITDAADWLLDKMILAPLRKSTRRIWRP
jgi:hypothetical protein